ncbi:MAG: Uncharacterised protein [Bacteroidota bacterium]|nr:MAG: Uncharacterised protein [Bacteroidota bacterium]
MKKILLIILLLPSWFCFSQEQKETVYLLFDKENNQKCLIEDGSGNSKYLNKFSKEYQGDIIYFKICDEIFSTRKTKNFIDTCSVKALDNLKFVDFDYIVKKYDSMFEFKHHVFEKIYFIEKISKDKIVKYEVNWVDDIMMIEN